MAKPSNPDEFLDRIPSNYSVESDGEQQDEGRANESAAEEELEAVARTASPDEGDDESQSMDDDECITEVESNDDDDDNEVRILFFVMLVQFMIFSVFVV